MGGGDAYVDAPPEPRLQQAAGGALPPREESYMMQELLRSVAALARRAGEMIRQEWYRPDGPRGAADKADIDVEVEEFLRYELGRLLPGSVLLGEELGASGELSGVEFCWLVDPHDGTAAFLRGFRGSSVSIGLLKNQQPILGVVFAPLYPNDRGDLIAGGPDLGLWRNGEPWSAPPSERPLQPEDRVALSQDADLRPLGNLSMISPARYLALPSVAYRLALAAVGDVRVAGTFVFVREHDVAAAHALLLSSGKVLKPWQVGNDTALRYTPRITPSSMLGGELGPVEELRGRDHGLVWAHPKGEPLSPRPLRPAPWKEQGLSLERAQGCLLGQLVGDALGSLVEFRSAASIVGSYPSGPDHLFDGGTWDTLAGQPTDDSEMALALARQLITEQRFDGSRVLEAYQSWLSSEPFDIGGTIARALQGKLNFDSQANGSLMRCSPLGIAFTPEQLTALALQESDLTHPHPLCGQCCRIFTQTISRGVAGMPVQQAIELALAQSQGEAHKLLQAARKAPPAEFQENMGWIRIAFQNAFFWLGQGSSLEEAVVQTVRQGGDSDTNAAIVGALVGAFQGLQAVPHSWLLSVLSCRPALGYGASRRPRPSRFWPVDALNLAELLLEVRCR